MRSQDKYDAVVIIGCKREQVLEIISYIRERFPDVEVSYEVIREEIL